MEERLLAIDWVRGLIMALMALDHTRAFFFGSSPDPTDLAVTTPALFGTRWITHLCAPGFLLLAGISAGLQKRTRSTRSLSLYLASRGVLLIGLEVTVVTFAWAPDPGLGLIVLQVIWAIGWSMLLLAALIHLDARVVGAIGVVLMLIGPWVGPSAFGAPAWLHVLLWEGGTPLALGEEITLFVLYPILPWAGVMAAGYGLSTLFTTRPRHVVPALVGIAGACVIGFLGLRFASLGLDPRPWMPSLDSLMSVMSFLNVSKYPPSPLFLLITLGLVCLLLASAGRLGANKLATAIATLGRAPLFFYLLHLYVLRAAGLALAGLVWGFENLGPPPSRSTPGWPLPAVWATWLAAMAGLYWPTRWFADLKMRRRSGWLGLF